MNPYNPQVPGYYGQPQYNTIPGPYGQPPQLYQQAPGGVVPGMPGYQYQTMPARPMVPMAAPGHGVPGMIPLSHPQHPQYNMYQMQQPRPAYMGPQGPMGAAPSPPPAHSPVMTMSLPAAPTQYITPQQAMVQQMQRQQGQQGQPQAPGGPGPQAMGPPVHLMTYPPATAPPLQPGDRIGTPPPGSMATVPQQGPGPARALSPPPPGLPGTVTPPPLATSMPMAYPQHMMTAPGQYYPPAGPPHNPGLYRVASYPGQMAPPPSSPGVPMVMAQSGGRPSYPVQPIAGYPAGMSVLPPGAAAVKVLGQAPPNTTPTEEPNKSGKSSLGKVTSAVLTKVDEVRLLATNKAKNTFTAISNLWKGTEDLEGLNPPPGAYRLSLFNKYKDQLTIDENMFEQLYYLFRSLADEKTERIPMATFARLIPGNSKPFLVQHLYYLMLGSVTGSQSQGADQGIDFERFILSITWIVSGTPINKLTLVYGMITKHSTLPLTVELLYSTMSMIAIEMAEVGLFGKLRAKDVDKILTMAFSEQQAAAEGKAVNQVVLSQVDFMANGSLSSDLIHCFGLLRYLNKFLLERIQLAKASPFDPIMGIVPYKEGFLNKHYKGVTNKWSIHWCLVVRGFFVYWNDLETYAQPHRVLSLVNATVEKISVPGKIDHGFQISVGDLYQRKFGCWSEEERERWVSAIQVNCQNKHRFDSTFPVRSGVKGDFYVDGVEGFTAISSAIRTAKESIFISDWYFSCELFLIRQGKLSDEDRLDLVLKSKAEDGVKICILLWNETKIVTPLNSEYVQNRMQGLSKNIWVQRHPLMHPIKWSHHQKIVVVDQDVAFVGGLDLCFGRFDDVNHYITDPDSKIWPGKDFYNPVVAPFDAVEVAFEDGFDRKKHPRMGWHDVHSKVEGEAARDVARNFIERWNWVKQDLSRISSPLLYPKTSVCPVAQGPLTVQVLRSLGAWHFKNLEGFANEQSIYKAYLHLIENSERFIYIENQFFISSLAGEPVINEVAQALYNRIKKAITENKPYRVVVILPVHPDGTYKDDSGIRYLMKWQYHTINRGDNSVLAQLARDFPTVDASQYITFNALRKAERLYTIGKCVTEQIYVHSKLLIVDDRIALIGSANINDRSFMGDRDSEIAVVIEDTTPNPYAFQLRKKLWCEHLGLPYPDQQELVKDPMNDQTWNNLWLKTAKANTEIFRQVFPLAPDDSIASLKDIEAQKLEDSTQAWELLQGLRGHLIEFPLNFLRNTKLDPDDIATSIVDVDIFT